MTRITETAGQPSLNDLMVRFLATRSDAASWAAVEPSEGEVEPHEVAAGFRVDARAAWSEATISVENSPKAPPSEWATLVGQPTAVFAVPMAAGNFPQRVKDLQPLLNRFEPSELRPSGEDAPSPGLSTLRTWVAREAKKPAATASLLAAGVARVIGDLDWADELLGDAEARCGGDLRAVWENERAALLWQRGRCAEALTAWEGMAATPTIQFNRGMALLFLGRPTDAAPALSAAAASLPETSGWSDLARLYLAVAEIHGG